MTMRRVRSVDRDRSWRREPRRFDDGDVAVIGADLDREIEYAFDTDEPMLGRPPAGDVE